MTVLALEREIITTALSAPDAKTQLEEKSGDPFNEFVDGLDKRKDLDPRRLVKLSMGGRAETIQWIGFTPETNGHGPLPQEAGSRTIIQWLRVSKATGLLEISASNGGYNGKRERIAMESGEIIRQDPPRNDQNGQIALFEELIPKGTEK